MGLRLYEVTVTRRVYVVARGESEAYRLGRLGVAIEKDVLESVMTQEKTCVPAEVSQMNPMSCLPEDDPRMDWTIKQWLEAIAKEDADRDTKADMRQLTIPGAKL